MKNWFLILMISALAFNSAEGQSMIKVKLTDNSPLNVAVDHRYFNKRGTSVTVGDLPAGRHFVQIYSFERGRRGRGYDNIIYEGRVRTQAGRVTILEFDPYSRNTSISEEDINAYMANRAPVRNNDPMQGEDINNNGDNNSVASPVASSVAIGSLTQPRIDQLKTTIEAKKTDTEKTNFLKSELKDDQLTTSQVGMIMDWLGFESSKLDFAEWAWNITVDRYTFNTLEDKFTYKNYRDDLDKFLKTK